MATVSLRRINGLVRDIYAGVGDVASLERAIKRIRRLVNGSSAMLFYPTQAPDEAEAGIVDELDIGFYARYLNEIRDHDVWLLEARRKNLIRTGNTFTNEMLLPDQAFRRLPIYHEAHVPMDATRVCCGVLVGEGDSDLPPTLLSVFRGTNSTPYGVEDRRILALLSPHLEQALRLSHRLGRANVQARIALEVLDKLGSGVLLLDASRNILFMNKLAERLCVRERGLLVQRGAVLGQCWLSALEGRYDDLLQSAITQSLLAMDRSRDQSLVKCPRPVLIRCQAAGAIVVRALPLRSRHLEGGTKAARAMVLVDSPDEQALGVDAH